MFEFVNEVDHVFTHGTSLDSIYKSAIFVPGIFCLDFFYYLFTKRTNFRWTCDGHVFVTFISEINKNKREYGKPVQIIRFMSIFFFVLSGTVWQLTVLKNIYKKIIFTRIISPLYNTFIIIVWFPYGSLKNFQVPDDLEFIKR